MDKKESRWALLSLEEKILWIKKKKKNTLTKCRNLTACTGTKISAPYKTEHGPNTCPAVPLYKTWWEEIGIILLHIELSRLESSVSRRLPPYLCRVWLLVHVAFGPRASNPGILVHPWGTVAAYRSASYHSIADWTTHAVAGQGGILYGVLLALRALCTKGEMHGIPVFFWAYIPGHL